MEPQLVCFCYHPFYIREQRGIEQRATIDVMEGPVDSCVACLVAIVQIRICIPDIHKRAVVPGEVRTVGHALVGELQPALVDMGTKRIPRTPTLQSSTGVNYTL